MYAVFCLISRFFIIQLAPIFYGLPIIEQTRIVVQVGLPVVAAILLTLILSLSESVTPGINQVGQGIGPSLTNRSLWNWRNVQMTSSSFLSLMDSWPSYMEDSMLEKYLPTSTLSPRLSPHFFLSRRLHPPHLLFVSGNRRKSLIDTRSLHQWRTQRKRNPCRWYCHRQLPHRNHTLRLQT